MWKYHFVDGMRHNWGGKCALTVDWIISRILFYLFWLDSFSVCPLSGWTISFSLQDILLILNGQRSFNCEFQACLLDYLRQRRTKSIVKFFMTHFSASLNWEIRKTLLLLTELLCSQIIYTIKLPDLQNFNLRNFP